MLLLSAILNPSVLLAVATVLVAVASTPCKLRQTQAFTHTASNERVAVALLHDSYQLVACHALSPFKQQPSASVRKGGSGRQEGRKLSSMKERRRSVVRHSCPLCEPCTWAKEKWRAAI